ncbi:TlpA disulfide reductase family protein [Luteimonas sp. RD2P54]|uniref:TlpA disulfide reductase family protein n=1 Tax=Luteimonas endophytica TaxID=3042023 RepID=A0ABT6J5M2_9GAMM|nr:TlpA disulfide reductase family protein [Luteimonas endophytica]MDH5822132.1 TlpA disulfide reductase family protein [Luteimonas endophytica]
MTLPRLLLFVCALALAVACRREPGPGADPAAVRPDQPPVQETTQRPDGAAAPTDPPADGPQAAPAGPPALQVTTVDGAAYDLADHRGKWVVVNFWATWCAPCLKEMPELSALGAMHEHIEVIGLAYEEIEADAMRAFLDKHPVLYPVAIVDVYAPPADFETPRGLPMTYLIAPDGTVARQFLGPVTAHEIESAIAAAGGPEAAPA